MKRSAPQIISSIIERIPEARRTKAPLVLNTRLEYDLVYQALMALKDAITAYDALDRVANEQTNSTLAEENRPYVDAPRPERS